MWSSFRTVHTNGIVKLPVEPPPIVQNTIVDQAIADAGGEVVFNLAGFALDSISDVVVELSPAITNLVVEVQSITPSLVTAIVRPVVGLSALPLAIASALIAGAIVTLTAIGETLE